MTVIAAIKTKEHVVMGGDSAGVLYYNLTSRRDPKVFHVGPFLVGYTSSFRMAQLIRFDKELAALKPPKGNGFKFMVTKFIPRIRTILKEGGFTKVEHNEETIGTFLVAWSKQLFQVEGDLQVGEPRLPYMACGSGEQYALGAFHCLLMQPFAVRVALEAAAKHCTTVSGPFTILET